MVVVRGAGGATELSVGDKVEAIYDEELGTPLYIRVMTDKGVRVYPLFSEVEDDWFEAQIIYYNTERGRETLLDTLAHIIEFAVKKLFPRYLLAGRELRGREVRVDFYTEGRPFTSVDIDRISLEARRIIETGGSLNVKDLDKKELARRLEESGERFLLKLLDIYETPVLVEREGTLSLCDKKEHLPDLSLIKLLEITNTSMTHWMGREEGEKLYSIHVTGYPSELDKKIFTERLEEIRKRDHVRLGREMDIFLTSPLVGQGLPLWAPNGALIKRVLEDYITRIHLLNGYQLVQTPHLATAELFKISGHLDHYRHHMFLFEMEGKLHSVKPMNCPFHILIFKRKKWSYRELPVRYFELGTVYRYERAGTLHGLTRVRGFVIDDAHIFLREDQIEEEITRIISLMREIYSTIGLEDYRFTLSLRDPENRKNYMGDISLWEKAENALESALKKMNISYIKEVGEAAFYGPKIDIKFTDALGREWQCATIQLDFNLPERFDLKYIDSDNKEKRLVMIHRALLGSVERFIGILLEQYAGRLPLWLSPIQVAVLPIEESDDRQVGLSERLNLALSSAGYRSVLLAEGRLGARIREARRLRIPLLLMIGKKEVEKGSISAKYITYAADEKKRFRPREEELVFESTEELLGWLGSTIRKQTNNVMG